MTGYSTGIVMVAAYDTAQNVAYSLPRMVQIKDVKAPAPMKNFKAEASIEDGTITLTWEPDSLDDDIEYYEVLFANDTTHSFVQLNKGKLTENRYVDTVAMDVNQKYIYYKVRAVDYSTNQSEDTKDNFAFAFQVTPIGMDFGGESFRGFAELGLGMQGLVNVGIRWLF